MQTLCWCFITFNWQILNLKPTNSYFKTIFTHDCKIFIIITASVSLFAQVGKSVLNTLYYWVFVNLKDTDIDFLDISEKTQSVLGEFYEPVFCEFSVPTFFSVGICWFSVKQSTIIQISTQNSPLIFPLLNFKYKLLLIWQCLEFVDMSDFFCLFGAKC